MNGFRPGGVLSVHPSLNRPCHLKTRLLEIPLYMSVLFRCLNESFEVITVSTQNWIAVRRAFSASNVAIFISL